MKKCLKCNKLVPEDTWNLHLGSHRGKANYIDIPEEELKRDLLDLQAQKIEEAHVKSNIVAKVKSLYTYFLFLKYLLTFALIVCFVIALMYIWDNRAYILGSIVAFFAALIALDWKNVPTDTYNALSATIYPYTAQTASREIQRKFEYLSRLIEAKYAIYHQEALCVNCYQYFGFQTTAATISTELLALQSPQAIDSYMGGFFTTFSKCLEIFNNASIDYSVTL